MSEDQQQIIIDAGNKYIEIMLDKLSKQDEQFSDVANTLGKYLTNAQYAKQASEVFERLSADQRRLSRELKSNLERLE